MTKEHKDDANYFVKSLQTFITDADDKKLLYSMLYVQVDNCTNKKLEQLLFCIY